MTEVIATEPEARTPAVVDVSTEGEIRAESDVIVQNKKPEEPRPDIISPPPILRCIPRAQYEPPKCEWREELSLDIFKDLIRPTLKMLDFDVGDFDIEPLATGAHNKVYTLTVFVCVDCGLAEDYVLQVAMPLDPYFKVECEAATTELVRHFTRIPVPIICAYDSSPKMELGLEWMLMEKISGQPLVKRWLDLHKSDHMRIARQVADWQDQLSKITSNQLGWLYLQWTATELQFFIGRCVEASFYEDRHILYHFPRGPFRGINEFYDSMITNQTLTYNDDGILLLEVLEDFGTPAELLPRLEALRPKCQEMLSREVHPDERENKGSNGPPLRPELQSALEALRHPTAGGTMHTRLAQEDVSLNNIMIDANINVVALLDREHVSLLPNILIEKHPALLLDQDDSEQLPGPRPDQVPVDDVEVGVWRKDNHESLREIQARLRPDYKHRVEELDSTLPHHLNEEDDLFESDLHNWCCQVTPNPKELMEWVEVQLQETPESSDDEAFESFRSVPLPQHPIQVLETGPQSLCLQAQYQWMELTPHGKHGAQAEWRVEPNLALLEMTVQSALSLLSVYGDYKVVWLPSGDFNSGYSVEATEENTAQPAHLIFRIPAIDFDSTYLRRLSYGFNCCPFKSMFDPYDATLQHTLEEARDAFSEPLNSTYLEDEGKIAVDGLQQEFQALISTELHKDDIEKWLGYGLHRVGIMQGTSTVARLRMALPAFRPPGAGLACEIYLQHRDIRVGNIVMDSPGNITALLDWEHVVLKPVLLHDPWPLMIHGRRGVDCSELNSQTIGHRGNPPGAQEWRTALELLEDVIVTNLRKGYKQHLQELESSLVVYRKDLREEDMRLLAWLSGPPHYSDLVSKTQPETSSGHDADDQEPVHTPKSSVEQLCEETPQPWDILRSIPKPLYPIRVCEEGPHSMSQNARRCWLKTTVSLWASDKDEWRAEPKIELIAEVVAPTLEHLGVDSSTTRVSKLACGGFNQVFTITAIEKNSSALREFVFRVPLPVNPYYKTECEVATMELVRASTSVRLPVVYAYDSSTNNKIGLEWILMAKIPGEALSEKWHDLSEDTLVDLTKQLADWQTELCSIQSTKIGGIYMRWVAEQLEFFVGPSIDLAFSRSRALYYDVPHGPFESLNDFYSARLQLSEQELLDPLYLILSKANAPPDQSLHLDQQTILSRLLPMEKEILGEELYEDERENREESGPQLRWTEQSLPAVRALKNALRVISPTDPSHAMVTILAHNDLAERNIMVDAGGRITGLLDWEYLDLQSLLFMKMKPYPEFVGSDEEEKQEADDDIEMMSNSGDETEDERLERLRNERYQAVTARLRTVYQDRLEELESPLLELLDTKETPDTVLRDRAIYEIEDDQEMIDWVDDQLKALAVQSSTLESDDGVNLTESFERVEAPDTVLNDLTGCAIETDEELMDWVVE